MTDSPLAANKEQGDLSQVRERNRIMARTAWKEKFPAAESLNCSRKLSNERRRAGHGSIVLQDTPAQNYLASLADLLGQFAQPAGAVLAQPIFVVPDIEAERHSS